MIEEIVEKEGRLDILVNNFRTSNADKKIWTFSLRNMLNS